MLEQTQTLAVKPCVLQTRESYRFVISMCVCVCVCECECECVCVCVCV